MSVHKCPHCGVTTLQVGNDPVTELAKGLFGAPSKQVQLCPVCLGRGIVPSGFYMVPAGQGHTTSDARPDKCRTCAGQGVL
jgi:hypothetical protein